MKYLIAAALMTTSFLLQASEKYDCDFTGPNYLLTIEDNGAVTLENSFKSYSCKQGTTTLPGTEVDLKIFNCISKNDRAVYFYGYDGNGDLVISKTLSTAGAIRCKRL